MMKPGSSDDCSAFWDGARERGDGLHACVPAPERLRRGGSLRVPAGQKQPQHELKPKNEPKLQHRLVKALSDKP